MKRKLMNLAIGEFAAVVVFIYLYNTFELGRSSFLAFSYLVFILLQGSIYWFYRYLLVLKKHEVGKEAGSILRILRWINLVMVSVLVLWMPILKTDWKDFLAATLILAFAMIEYLNYYWFRLSYGKSGFNIKILFREKLQKSSINKLISRSKG